MKVAKQKQKPGKASQQLVVVKTKARRAGDKAKSKPARPPAAPGRELTDDSRDDDRAWMDDL